MVRTLTRALAFLFALACLAGFVIEADHGSRPVSVIFAGLALATLAGLARTKPQEN